ncbi:MAG TPA: hypothetical protein VIV11_03695 [Kofleriaceae bacterium]
MRIGVLVIALWLTSIAHAEEPQKPEAREHLNAGGAAFTAGDYVEASKHFNAAYEIEPLPDLLWSWAQSERMAGRCVTAKGLYRKYAREAQTPSKVKAANDMIALCDKPVKPVKDARRTGESEPVQPLGPWYTNKLGGALTASGVVGVTVGITFLALAAGSHSESKQETYLDDFDSKLDETTQRRWIGGVSLGVGIGLLAAGAGIYLVHDRNQRALTAGTDGRVVFVGARF